MAQFFRQSRARTYENVFVGDGHVATTVVCIVRTVRRGGLGAETVQAQQAEPGIVRTMLQQSEGPAEGYMTILARGDVPPGAMVARHTHPGIATALILVDGGTLLMVGNTATSIASAYVVEKGKPLATQAPE